MNLNRGLIVQVNNVVVHGLPEILCKNIRCVKMLYCKAAIKFTK